ncbi:MAG TPA: 30S ribosomal protein S17 [Patescibacteria group bacterium]|nr:30S ribosomal protein S17 [Patescibacteria group bacterium]
MKIFQGKIVSNKNNKTLIIEVERLLAHPVYKKRFKRSKKYHVHSEKEHKIGEVIKFVETRPISKLKRWKVIEDEVKTVSTKKKEGK